MVEDAEEAKRQMVAAEYALGLLPAAEARAFEDEMDVSAAARADYAFWAEHFVALTDDMAPQTPPADILARLQNELFPKKQPARQKGEGWLSKLGLLPGIGAGLVAAAAALWVVGGVFDPTEPGVGAMATLVTEDGSLAVEVAYTEFGDTLSINRSAGTPPAGQVFQLWLIKDDQPPISLGVLPEEQIATLDVPEEIRPLLRGARCAISVEPPGGSPTGAPTGDILVEARIVWEA